MACKVIRYFRLFSSVVVSVLRTSINVLSKSKSKNYVTWIANLTKSFLSVLRWHFIQYKLWQKWMFLDWLLTSSCKRNLWTTPWGNLIMLFDFPKWLQSCFDKWNWSVKVKLRMPDIWPERKYRTRVYKQSRSRS